MAKRAPAKRAPAKRDPRKAKPGTKVRPQDLAGAGGPADE